MNLASPADFLSVFKPTTRTQWDVLTPIALFLLSAFGIAFIYSADLQSPLHHNDWMKQLVWLGLGVVLYAVVSLVDYRFWLSVSHWVYLACIVPLVLVLVPGIGKEVYGSRRWLFFFQPSETAKVCTRKSARSRSRWARWGNWPLRWARPCCSSSCNPT